MSICEQESNVTTFVSQSIPVNFSFSDGHVRVASESRDDCVEDTYQQPYKVTVDADENVNSLDTSRSQHQTRIVTKPAHRVGSMPAVPSFAPQAKPNSGQDRQQLSKTPIRPSSKDLDIIQRSSPLLFAPSRDMPAAPTTKHHLKSLGRYHLENQQKRQKTSDTRVPSLYDPPYAESPSEMIVAAKARKAASKASTHKKSILRSKPQNKSRNTAKDPKTKGNGVPVIASKQASSKDKTSKAIRVTHQSALKPSTTSPGRSTLAGHHDPERTQTEFAPGPKVSEKIDSDQDDIHTGGDRDPRTAMPVPKGGDYQEEKGETVDDFILSVTNLTHGPDDMLERDVVEAQESGNSPARLKSTCLDDTLTHTSKATTVLLTADNLSGANLGNQVSRSGHDIKKPSMIQFSAQGPLNQGTAAKPRAVQRQERTAIPINGNLGVSGDVPEEDEGSPPPAQTVSDHDELPMPAQTVDHNEDLPMLANTDDNSDKSRIVGLVIDPGMADPTSKSASLDDNDEQPRPITQTTIHSVPQKPLPNIDLTNVEIDRVSSNTLQNRVKTLSTDYYEQEVGSKKRATSRYVRPAQEDTSDVASAQHKRTILADITNSTHNRTADKALSNLDSHHTKHDERSVGVLADKENRNPNPEPANKHHQANTQAPRIAARHSDPKHLDRVAHEGPSRKRPRHSAKHRVRVDDSTQTKRVKTAEKLTVEAAFERLATESAMPFQSRSDRCPSRTLPTQMDEYSNGPVKRRTSKDLQEDPDETLVNASQDSDAESNAQSEEDVEASESSEDSNENETDEGAEESSSESSVTSEPAKLIKPHHQFMIDAMSTAAIHAMNHLNVQEKALGALAIRYQHQGCEIIECVSYNFEHSKQQWTLESGRARIDTANSLGHLSKSLRDAQSRSAKDQQSEASNSTSAIECKLRAFMQRYC